MYGATAASQPHLSHMGPANIQYPTAPGAHVGYQAANMMAGSHNKRHHP